MLIQIYNILFNYHDTNKEHYICGAIAKHNGFYSANYNTFISKMRDQIISLAEGHDVSPEFLQDIWSADNFEQIYDRNFNTIYKRKCISYSANYNLNVKCNIIYYRNNPSVFISIYANHILFRQNFTLRYDIYYHFFKTIAEYECTERNNHNLSFITKLYSGCDVEFMHGLGTHEIAKGLYECYKVIFQFPNNKKWHTDCSLICGE